MSVNPFLAPSLSPGHGIIHLNVLPPNTPVLEKLSYQYPLKLIAPSPLTVSTQDEHDTANSRDVIVHTVFMLTYGGGLVAGDRVSLTTHLAASTRLVLLTQGSTKIFKSPDAHTLTHQHMTVDIDNGAALCYLPDPVQPFESSAFEQRQTYNILGETANLCVCDGVSEGRTARGEKWAFRGYASRNEVWLSRPEGRRRLLLRDNLFLDASAVANEGLLGRMDEMGVFGTLIICGPLFRSLSAFFLAEFKLLPRIGNRQWDALDESAEISAEEQIRGNRLTREKKDGLLWTVAATRGFVVVKFGAREVEGAKRWLRTMLRTEGSVEREFGERALLCLR